MLPTEAWAPFIIAVVVAAIIGYLIGHRRAPGGQNDIRKLKKEYEQQLSEKKTELEAYQQQVHEHYDNTAGLFKNMAGSYKELFDHLSTGYQQLGHFPDKSILPERAGALLDGPEPDAAEESLATSNPVGKKDSTEIPDPIGDKDSTSIPDPIGDKDSISTPSANGNKDKPLN